MNAPEPEGFAEPWQAQAFAIVVALHERGLFDWAEWTQALGAEIARAPQRDYYDCWLQALEAIVERKGAARQGELEALAQAWLDAAEATPHGEPIVLGRRSPAD